MRFWKRICGSLLTYTRFLGLFIVTDVNQGLSPSLPSGDFPGEGVVVSFRDAIHHKHLIKIPKQYAILLRIELRTRWLRFGIDAVNMF